MHASSPTHARFRRARALFPPAFAALAFLAASVAAGSAAATDRYELVGSAVKSRGSLQLTQWKYDEAGALWGHHPLHIDRSFSVDFSFSLKAPHGIPPQADGIALVIQVDGRQALGANGGGIGYLGLHGVASVVQTWVNNHVGLSLDGDPYDAPAAPADLGAAVLVTGEETVTYDAATHLLSMTGRLDVDGVPYDIADSREVDLVALLGSPEAIIGFTGGTGGALSDQRIRSWRLQYLS
jgi:hypothetical protein